MLKSTKELLLDAQKKVYAVPQFNVYNLETIKAALAAAEEAKSPLILAVTPGTREYAGDAFMFALAKTAAMTADVPIAYHLDHHTKIEDIIPSLELGAKSVMVDGSMLPYEENIALVRRAVKAARPHGASVEAELGKLLGVEDGITVEAGEDALTDPDLARDFLRRSEADTLAVAIGTAHGLYKEQPKLDIERLKRIREKTDAPLVLHGASGLDDASVRTCIENGITKVNIATELKMPYAKAIRDYFEKHPDASDPRKYFAPAKETLRRVALKKIDMCGSGGMAG